MKHQLARPQSSCRPTVILSALVVLLVARGFALAAPPTTPTVPATPTPTQLPQGSHQYPKPQHFDALTVYVQGDYANAGKGFKNAASVGLQVGDVRWIDSICYFAMEGECFYHEGRYSEALQSYDKALRWFLVHKDWMQKTEFDQAIQPQQSGSTRLVPTWGPSTRKAQPGRFDMEVVIRQGRLDNENVIKNGGMIQPLQLLRIHPAEIARCTAVAIRRYAQILGPAAKQDKLMLQVAEALSTRPGLTNNWSMCWVEMHLGLAFQAMGDTPMATQSLRASLLAGGQYDHPLTCMALLELGRIAFNEQKYDLALTQFHEASISAAYFGDVDVLEEAFRGGLAAHLASGKTELFPPLAPAKDWANSRRMLALQSSLWLLAAENFCALRQPDKSALALQQADIPLHKLSQAAKQVTYDLHARAAHVAAMMEYQRGSAVEGNKRLKGALTWERDHSLRLFQQRLVDERAIQNQFSSDRIADELYETVLREPTADDWATDPLESLAVTQYTSPEALEHWFELALKRQLPERALEISETIRRRRFYDALELGGRLLSLRWIMAAPADALSPKALRQRQELNRRYPQFAVLAKQSDDLRKQAASAPLDDARSAKKGEGPFPTWQQVAAQQEVILREMSVRREPAVTPFPPPLNLPDFQKKLPPGRLVISLFGTTKAVYVFTIRSDKYGNSKIDAPEQVHKDSAALLKLLGQIDKQATVESTQFEGTAWKAAAKSLATSLLGRLKTDFWKGVEEVVIVPDGFLWYVPFETLPVGPQGDAQPLALQTILRYAPTVSLALPDGRGFHTSGRTTIAIGRLMPRDGEQIAQTEYARLAKVVDQPLAVKSPLLVPSQPLAALSDTLVVLDDIGGDKSAANLGPLDFSPMQFDAGKPGSSLSSWISLPFGGPDRVILPGFHSEAENGLKKKAAGEELSQAVLGFMAMGTRTVLISRWRPGGQSSYDLVREFAQELPHSAAAVAWQRSVSLMRESQLDLAREPRVRQSAKTDTLKGEHPFFWAGFILVDTGLAPPTDKPMPAAAPVAAPAVVAKPDPAAKPAAKEAPPNDLPPKDPPAPKPDPAKPPVPAIVPPKPDAPDGAAKR